MKINFLLPHIRLSGGVKGLLEYANRLKKIGHEVNIFIPSKRLKWYHLVAKWKERNRGLQILPSQAVDWMSNSLPIGVFPELEPSCISDADILVASAWQTAEFAVHFPQDKGKPFYFIQHYETLWAREKNRAGKTYDLPMQQVTISTWLKDILNEKHGIEADVLVTPVDREVFFCDSKKWNSIPRIAMLHHDYNWKGYAEGIEAIKKVMQQERKIQLVVFGEKLEDPQPLFDKAGFSFEYHYRPTRELLRKIYASCDIFLCPSWYEGLGMPSMEAMACRCSLVTADTGGCLDFAIHGKTALVSPSRDTKGLSQNIIRLLDDEVLLESISQNGYHKISEFDWRQNCDQLLCLFEKYLSAK
jgi:glycosyltransferase involved in cell wall biosynthesis